MLNIDDVENKFTDATLILRLSMGENGIYAGSGPRYDQQCWTRDVCLALIPAFNVLIDGPTIGEKTSEEDAQLYLSACDGHLGQLALRQGSDGAIPILYADDFGWLVVSKLRGKAGWDGKNLDAGNSFVLKRILDGMLGDEKRFPEFADFSEAEERGLYRLTPGTTDSELMFAFATYSQQPGLQRVHKARCAVYYLEKHYVWNGLHYGADWRDTMEVFFRNKPLLTNNALLYAVYKMSGDVEKAGALKAEIERVLWDGEAYLDYPGATRFDPLGASLGVLHGLIPKERYASVMAGFKSVDTPYGVTIQCKHNPHQDGEAEVIERTQGVVVWPFVVGFTILAALEMGEHDFALEQFKKLHELDGFAEWYDPADGSKWGEYKQGWSAAMYIRAADALSRHGLL